MTYSDTRAEAYEAQGKPHLTRFDALREAIFEELKKNPDKAQTPEQMADATGIDLLTVRPRFTFLLQLDRIKDAGVRGTTKYGRSCKAYVINKDHPLYAV